MDNERNNRHRNTYLLLIGAGVFLLLHQLIGFGTLLALGFLGLGIHRIRSTGEKKGYVLCIIGLLVLAGNHLSILIAIVLISLGFFFMKSKDFHKNDRHLQKQSLLESIRWVREPFVLRSISIWHVVGEIQMDLSLAIFEESETTVVMQGVVGDIDIFVPEDVGVSVQASVFFGQAEIGREKEAGVMNKIVWQSPHYVSAEHRVKLYLTYGVGDINVKVL